MTDRHAGAGFPERVRKRDSDVLRKSFPFEVIHTAGPANNMTFFHWHDFMEISRVESGKGVYEIEGKRYAVEAGDIIVINNIERHRVTYGEADPLYETVLHFAPSLVWTKENSYFDYHYLKLFLYEGARFNNRPRPDDALRREMGDLMRDIKSEYLAKPAHYELMIKSKLLTLIAHLIRLNAPRTEPGEDYLLRKRNIERIEAMLKFVNDHFKEDVTLGAIAGEFSMNPAYFSDFFSRNVGVTFRDYLVRLRINEAMRLFTENRLNSTEIAYAVGFASTASFYKAFRRVTGGSPADFRGSIQN